MTTHHRGVGHRGKDRDLNSYVEDTGNIDDNESMNGSETLMAFLRNILLYRQADFNMLT